MAGLVFFDKLKKYLVKNVKMDVIYREGNFIPVE
jgi:hypothetical protein